jgi:predicted transcriptional regulator
LILLRIQKRIPKISQKDLSSKYDIGKATVCDNLKRKDEYRRQFEENIGIIRENGMSVQVNFLT